MITIRLIRTGKRNASAFKVVLIDKKAAPQSGKFLEHLGSYNARLKEISLKQDRIKYWLSKGACPSDTVHNLLVSQDIIKGPKIKKKFSAKKRKRDSAESEKAIKGEQVVEEDKSVDEESSTEKEVVSGDSGPDKNPEVAKEEKKEKKKSIPESKESKKP